MFGCSGEGLIQGAVDSRTPFHPPPSLWNPLIKLVLNWALKCRLVLASRRPPQSGGHFRPRFSKWSLCSCWAAQYQM